MREKILDLLSKDCRLTTKAIAGMINADESLVVAEINKMENEGIILCYKALINWEKMMDQRVSALIELKVTPQREEGFDEVAKKIYSYSEVSSLYLMSGGYDLTVIIEGKSMKSVALFVSNTLATMDNVTSTATHFVLKKYKDQGVTFEKGDGDNRQVITI